MKTTPFWWEAAEPQHGERAFDKTSCSVLIIGSGYTCQRRNKNRPRGGAKVGHDGARMRPPGGRSPSGGLMRAWRFFEEGFSQPFGRGSGRGDNCRRSSQGC